MLFFFIDREAEERQKAKDAVWEGQMECPGAGGFPWQELVYAPGEAEDLREKDPAGIRKVPGRTAWVRWLWSMRISILRDAR